MGDNDDPNYTAFQEAIEAVLREHMPRLHGGEDAELAAAYPTDWVLVVESVDPAGAPWLSNYASAHMTSWKAEGMARWSFSDSGHATFGDDDA